MTEPFRPKTINAKGETVSETSAPLAKAPRDVSNWPKRKDVAELLGCGIHKVRNYEARGKLHPEKDAKGDHRFDPDEVGSLCIDLGIDDDTTSRWKEKAYGRIDLYASLNAYKVLNDNIKAVGARDSAIDERANRYMDRIDARNKYLEEENDRLRQRLDEVQTLKEGLQDKADERALVRALVQQNAEQDERKITVWGRIANNVQRFLFNSDEMNISEFSALELEVIKGGLFDVLDDDKKARIEQAIAKRAHLDEQARAAEAASKAEGPGPAKTEAPAGEGATNAA